MFPPDQLGNHSFLRGAHVHEETTLYDTFMIAIYMAGIIASIIAVSSIKDSKDN
jgi:hypothetical protein